jgi:hypothetical protein
MGPAVAAVSGVGISGIFGFCLCLLSFVPFALPIRRSAFLAFGFGR